MNKNTKEIVERYKDLLYKFQRTGECKPENGTIFWDDIKTAFYEETRDRVTANKITTGCGTCKRKAINHLIRLYERDMVERTTKGDSKAVQSTQPKKKRGRPRKGE